MHSIVIEKGKGVEKMQRDKTLKIGVSVILILLLAVATFAFAQPQTASPDPAWDFPRLDEIWMVAKYPETVTMEAAKAGDIDCWLGLIDPDDVAELSGYPYYWNVSMTDYGGFHMCYHGFNCRDTPPDTAGVYTNMFNRTTDFPLIPCNISSFRLALQHVVGKTTKESWIWDVYKYINRAQMFYVPFANEYWINPYLEWYDTDWDKAADILIENGFAWDYGPDGTPHTTDDKWTMPNGKVLYDGTGGSGGNGYSERYAGLDATGTPMYGIFVACPGDGLAPTSHEISRRHVKEWNRFFMGVEAVGTTDSTNTALFIDLPDDTYAYIYFSSFYNRDHDIYMLCWGLGRNPDYLYDLFSPDVDFPGWGNSPGLVHADLDDLLYAMKYWKLTDYEVVAQNIGDQPVIEYSPCDTITNPGPPTIDDVKFIQCHKTGVHRYVMLGPGDAMTFQNLTAYEWPLDPRCSLWNETSPTPNRAWHLEKWFDCDIDGGLSVGDTVGMFRFPAERKLGRVAALSYSGAPLYRWDLTLGPAYTIDPNYDLHIETCIDLYAGDFIKINYGTGTHSRTITNIEEMRDLVWLSQWMLYYLNPYNPIYSRNYINMFGSHAKPTYLEGWVESEGYGSAPSTALLPWTFANIHWEGTPVGGNVSWHIAGHCESINPILASWVYEVMIINRLYDTLYVIDPETHADMPWAACKWELIPYKAPHLGVRDGTILRVWLRNDVTWHDGSHVTAKDVKWNFDFINSTQAPEFIGLWGVYLGSEVVNEYCVDIYYNATGMWKAYDFLGSALLFPKIIWLPFWGDYAGAIAFKPQEVDYEAWTGCPAPLDKPGLTAYIGTGPFWMDFWDSSAEVGHVIKNVNYWARQEALPTEGVTAQLSVGESGLKKITGPTFEIGNMTWPTALAPYPDYEKSGIVNLEDPICSWWALKPDMTEWAHLDSWRDDNQDGVLSPCDNIDLLVNWPSAGMCGIYNFHVDEIVWDGLNNRWQLVISLAEIISYSNRITPPNIDIVMVNVHAEEQRTFTYELYRDAVLIDSGGETLDPTDSIRISGPAVSPGCHTYTLSVTTAAGTTTYTLKAGYLVGDANWDGITDMADISLLIDYFLTEPGHPLWDPKADFNDDLVVDMADISIAIDYFLEECGC